MTGSMSGVGFGCYDWFVVESEKGRMGSIAGCGEPIAWCD
jgi:hypothetical protein